MARNPSVIDFERAPIQHLDLHFNNFSSFIGGTTINNLFAVLQVSNNNGSIGVGLSVSFGALPIYSFNGNLEGSFTVREGIGNRLFCRRPASSFTYPEEPIQS
jgi:hypothetical protein